MFHPSVVTFTVVLFFYNSSATFLAIRLFSSLFAPKIDA
jgi:hypothetical protein